MTASGLVDFLQGPCPCGQCDCILLDNLSSNRDDVKRFYYVELYEKDVNGQWLWLRGPQF